MACCARDAQKKQIAAELRFFKVNSVVLIETVKLGLAKIERKITILRIE